MRLADQVRDQIHAGIDDFNSDCAKRGLNARARYPVDIEITAMSRQAEVKTNALAVNVARPISQNAP